ncbi:MAG: succinate dehydrogenase/fumarate reductase iron-sulfur subunit, partial [Candidatus Geothermarchaeales archaeon]
MASIIFRVQRFNPVRDATPHIEEYEVPLSKGMTVLDGLLYVKENLDGSLALRYSCRMSICGSCGMLINEVPRLACHTQVVDLETDIIEVRPLPNLPNVKDLVTDFDSFFEKHKLAMPYIIRRDVEELENPIREYVQTPDEVFKTYFQFTSCIKCGLCWSACPVSSTDKEYLGPQALTEVFRFLIDSRDDEIAKRMNTVDSPHGCWSCHFAASCSHVCPKGVDPALAIQLLKRMVLSHRLGLKKTKEVTSIAPPLKGVVEKRA